MNKWMISATLMCCGLIWAQTQTGSGAQVYQQQCQGCHQAGGQGLVGGFPPLAGHVPDLLAATGGRTYLINVLLYGLQGSIRVNGNTYSGVMPGFSQLSDAQIAGVLNHISTSWGNRLPSGQQAFSADQVMAQRGKNLTAAQVYAQRQQLGLE